MTPHQRRWLSAAEHRLVNAAVRWQIVCSCGPAPRRDGEAPRSIRIVEYERFHSACQRVEHCRQWRLIRVRSSTRILSLVRDQLLNVYGAGALLRAGHWELRTVPRSAQQLLLIKFIGEETLADLIEVGWIRE